jgi:NADH dehydrogenase
VEADLSLPGHENAYAVGDAAAVPWGHGGPSEGAICPQVAQVAIQSGSVAAAQVLHRIAGEPTETFRYHDKGIMATIGRRAAIAQFPKGEILRGTLGWLAWLGLHLVYLIGFRNRIVVLVNWSWRYLSWGSGPRVIVGDNLRPRPGSPPLDAAGPSQRAAAGQAKEPAPKRARKTVAKRAKGTTATRGKGTAPEPAEEPAPKPKRAKAPPP